MKLQINSLSNHSGKELRQLRERMGLSQSALSELMGIKQAKLSSFELEKSSLNDIELVKLKSTLLDDISIEKRLNRKKRYKQSSKNINIIQGMKLNRTYKKSERNSEYIDVLKNLWLKHTDNNKKINTISLFSGCGGFSLGASAAGFKIIGNVEKEAGAQRIYSTNFDSNFLGADITQINDANLKRIAGDLPPVRVIIGGPPCQGFSLTGKRNHEDKRNYLFKDYLRFIKVFNPVVAVMENVEKLLSMIILALGMFQMSHL